MSLTYAPIVLFAYERPTHTAQVLTSLSQNPEASASDLIIYIDGPKTPDRSSLTDQVYEVACSTTGFQTVTVKRRPINLGLSSSIIQGVTEVLAHYNSVIVLEDDILVSPFFLKYMNDGLALYSHNNEVASIHSYVYPVDDKLPETYFLRGANCWGWGTWPRAWNTFNPDGSFLLRELRRTGKAKAFDYDGNGPYLRMLKDQIRRRNDSWAVRWHASSYLANMYTLYPGISLVQNIGFDGTGSHASATSHLNVTVSNAKVKVERIQIHELETARSAFSKFFRDQKRYMHYPARKRLLIRLAKPILIILPKRVTEYLRRII